MLSVLEWLGLTAAFLAPMPPWQEPTPEPIRWPPSGWATGAVVGLLALSTALPVVIALDAYRAEGEFRERCEAYGGRVVISRNAQRPYDCAGG